MSWGLDLSLSLTRGQGGGAFEPEAAALFARFTTPPTGERKTLINTLIKALKDGGIWSKLDVLYLTAAADAQAARRNWIADAHNLSTINSPTFTADRGYAGNGSSSYLNTNYNPGDGGSHLYQQNNAHMAVWSRTNSDGLFVDLGARAGVSSARSNLLTRSAGVCNILINQDTAGSAASADSSGHQVTRRTASNATTVFRDASLLGTGSTASVAPANLNWFMGALNNNGTAAQFSARELAAAHAGASLSDGEITAMRAALSTYLTAIGAA